MKNCIIIAALLISSLASAAGVKKALVIAVGDYPKETKWGKISSDKDVPLIVKALDHHGFTPDNILIIQDAQATKVGIIAAFEKITREADPDDIIVIHYSGHGQQVWDKSGDELDGKDESIVPYDAQARFVPGQYEGENHLVDDELEKMVTDLRLAIGKNGSLTLILDACHSGTATRGDYAPSRGTTEFMGPKDWKGKDGKDQGTFQFQSQTRGEGEPEMAPMALFSGAAASQLNFETQDENGNFVGSLSYSISKALLNCSEKTTYRELFDMVKSEMSVVAPRQSPQVEGDIDHEIFGGKAAPRVKYFKNTKVIDAKTTIVSGGHLLGLFDQTKVGLYPAGTKSIEGIKPIATGTIINSNLVNADIIWDTEVKEDELRKGLVFVTTQRFSDIQVKVKLDINGNPDLLSAIQRNISRYENVIKLTDKSPDIIIEMNNAYTRGNQLQMINNSEMIVFQQAPKPNVEETAGAVTQGLLMYAQAQFLRELNTVNENIDLHMEIIPITKVKKVETGEGRNKRITTVEVERGNISDYIVDNTIVLKPGDFFKLKITNRGKEMAYFSVIDIQPDNIVNILLPGKGRTADEMKVRPGESIEVDQVFEIFEPYGMETFKLIATTEPLDLSMIVSTRGETVSDRVQSPFEKLFQSTYVQTRGAGTNDQDISVPPDVANIHNLVFRIEKR